MPTVQLRSLFPPLAPFKRGRLAVSGGHEIYFERSGKKGGAPAMYLHGGPGTGLSADQRRLFDPQEYDIIQFDQRGCGQSTPHGSLTDNTTDDLIADMVRLLDHFGLEKTHLVGGSWGSTLALAFALAHPERTHSLLVFGIFLCRPCEFRALYFKGGVVSQIYPDVFAPFIELLPEHDRDDPIRGYKKLFESEDKALRDKALYAWTLLEQRASKLITDETRLNQEMADPDYVLSHSLIENHYFLANGFIDGDEILRRAGAALADIPVHIINGRYDLVCPVITAHQLHAALPASTLEIIPDAGHSFREPGITDALVRQAERTVRQRSG